MNSIGSNETISSKEDSLENILDDSLHEFSKQEKIFSLQNGIENTVGKTLNERAYSIASGNPYSSSPSSHQSNNRKYKSPEIRSGSFPKSKQKSDPVDVQRVLESSWIMSQKELIKNKLIAAQKLKRERLRDEKASATQLERTIPIETLALDWFNENSTSFELRIYLIENLLPTLVLGMEKVLMKAEDFGLLNQECPDNDLGGTFSPINYLAQYLMRNNPRYTNLNESSPYSRGLRKVLEELKQDLLMLEENKLSKLKTDAKRKRETVEENEKRKENEARERARLLKMQFPHWLVDSGKLQLQLVQNALYSYLEISSHLASDTENVIHYSKELDPTDESGKTLTIQEYIDYLEEFVCEMTMPEFIQLLRHLDQCAAAFRRTFEREVWREMFVKLFGSLDSESCGYIDRHRMLHLLEKFWDKLENGNKEAVHNPRKWPVVELEELDDIYLDTDEDSGADESVVVSTDDLASSDWASTLLPGRQSEEARNETSLISGSQKQSSEPPASNIDEDAQEVASEGKSSLPPEEKEKRGSTEVVEGSPSSIESHGDEEESVKVSSAAGADAITPIKEATDEEVGTSEGVSPSVVADTPVEEEAKNIASQDSDAKESTPVDEDKVEKEQEAEEDPSDAKDQTKEFHDATDADPAQEGSKPDEEEAMITPEQPPQDEEKLVQEEEEIKQSPVEANKLLTNSGSNLAATLITPAPTTDESEDAVPVNVQFSKEVAPTKVRKTTSVTTVQLKSTQPSGEEGSDRIPDEATSYQQPVLPDQPPTATTSDGRLEDLEKDSETIVTAVAPSDPVLVQHTAEDMLEYDPQPMEVKTRPASTSRMSVTFAAEPLILPDRPSAEFFTHFSSRSQSRMTSVFDEHQLDERRFISLLENFIKEETDHPLVEQLVNFIHGGYVETEEEKMARLEKARREVLSAKHRQMVDNLFNKWDNDGQGYLDNEEVDNVLLKYKGGVESSSLKRARQALRAARKNAPYHDRRRINRKEFHVYINAVCDSIAGGEEVFDGLVEFVTSTVERTYTERVRGEARRKWLSQILSSAATGGASMEHVYRAVFQSLRKDAEAHGNQKKMSSYIALLEHNLLSPDRGPVLLRYVACTPDNAPFMLGKAYYEDMKGISFYAVRRGKLVHVPRVQSHGRIHFWNPSREEGDREGSLVLVPIRDERRRTFGLLGVDNVDSAASTDRSIFASHEISFYQGVAKSFSSAFHHVDLRKKLLRIVDASMSWVHSRAPRVRNIVVYFVEPDPKGQGGNVLRKMVTADNNTGLTITHTRPQRLYRKDNLFRDYLFKTMENSETTSADAYGDRHTAYPLRDEDGRCQCVIDISIGKLKALPKHEHKEVQRMLKLLQAANREVMKESIGGEKTMVLEAEEKGSDDMRVEIMFDRLMLTDLRENVSKLDSNVFAELKNYKEPPPMIHNILQAVLLLFHQDAKILPELSDWTTCRQMVTGKLRQWIISYDPTSQQETLINEEEINQLVQLVGKLLKGIPHGAVAKQGSRPTQQLYNWAFVCLSLIEHARKMKQNEGQPAVTPVTSASTNTTQESLEVGGENY